jgi:hypothetical protein
MSDFPTKILKNFLIFHLCATRYVIPTTVKFTVIIMLVERLIRVSSLISFLQSPVSTFFLHSTQRNCSLLGASQNCDNRLLALSRLSAGNSAPTGRIFMKFDIWVFLENLSRKIQVSLKSDKNNWYFIWRLYTFLIISRSIILRIRNISYQHCRRKQNTHFVFSYFFSKIILFFK